MQLSIVAIGKGRASPENVLTRSWLSRLKPAGQIIEIESKLPTGPKRTEDEAQRLLRAIPDGAALVVLDPRGEDYSSEEFAAMIGRWRDEGFKSAFFAIGGADGHANIVHQKANHTIALGRATWPHMLFRAMLAEQLYRANAILAGHPYHRAN